MLTTLDDCLFLAINASAHPDAAAVDVAAFATSWLVYTAVALIAGLWIWGRRDARGALLATVLGVSAALAVDQHSACSGTSRGRS